MSRLTYKRLDSEYSVSFPIDNLVNANNLIMTKLGKLEDLENELGCPLDVVFKALKNEKIAIYTNDCLLPFNEFKWLYTLWIAGTTIIDDLEER